MEIKKSLKLIYKATIGKYFPPSNEILQRLLGEELNNCSSVIDLGCGSNSLFRFLKDNLAPTFYSVGIDIFEPYLLESKKKAIHSKYIKSNILDIKFPPNFFSCALLLDVIEHLEKKEVLDFLPKLEKMVKKIIILVPNGFVNQNIYDNNIYQVHKSGWTLREMEEIGFKCVGLSGLKCLRGESGVPTIKPRVVGGVISNITQPFIYKRPKIAFHLFCVKKTKKK